MESRAGDRTDTNELTKEGKTAETMSKVKQLPARNKVKEADTWDLASLFPDDAAWEKAFKSWERSLGSYAKFKGTLKSGPKALAECLKFDLKFDRAAERLGIYAMLKTTEDTADSDYQGMKARYVGVASRAAQAASYLRPEILAIPAKRMKEYLASKELKAYRLLLERLVRHKPHTLGEKEETLLAMQTEMAQVAEQTFNQLNNADLKFGNINVGKGETIELSHGSFSKCLNSPKRSVREKAFRQYYAEYADHAHTLAATFSGSIQRDVYYARARDFPSAREAALFGDNVPVSVYDNLIESVHRNLPALYRYYDVRKRAMKLDEIHQYDTYVPIISELESRHTWAQATSAILKALEPLGSEYCGVLEKGLKGRWCDRYENKGKQSGAFSCGSFDADPFILMNYQPDVLNHVFTLAHEAGHSMHSHYSAKNQPYQYYNYTIFVAEVASTFNEQLLADYLMSKAGSAKERAYYINRELDDMRGTILRQTMFAEFEKIAHELTEANEPLTLDRLKSEYRKLLDLYFGPDFTLDDELDLECLRIPHFYRAFYVYKYATGMSAAIALADRVTKGGEKELGDYLGFLSGGCSKFPLELLRDAGVDMEQPEPVDTALARFAQLVDELDELL